MTFVLNLPWPPSVNHANRIGRSRSTGKMVVYGDKGKKRFFEDAQVLLAAQRRHVARISGAFTYHLTLNEKERHGNSDGDNRGKYVLDFLQSSGLIDNDKLAQGGSWAWGPCEYGCNIIVKPFSRQGGVNE